MDFFFALFHTTVLETASGPSTFVLIACKATGVAWRLSSGSDRLSHFLTQRVPRVASLPPPSAVLLSVPSGSASPSSSGGGPPPPPAPRLSLSSTFLLPSPRFHSLAHTTQLTLTPSASYSSIPYKCGSQRSSFLLLDMFLTEATCLSVRCHLVLSSSFLSGRGPTPPLLLLLGADLSCIVACFTLHPCSPGFARLCSVAFGPARSAGAPLLFVLTSAACLMFSLSAASDHHGFDFTAEFGWMKECGGEEFGGDPCE